MNAGDAVPSLPHRPSHQLSALPPPTSRIRASFVANEVLSIPHALFVLSLVFCFWFPMERLNKVNSRF